MRVFILEEPKRELDVSTAEAFGTVHYLFQPSDRRASIFQPSAYARDVYARLAAVDFDPSVDAFVIVGAMLNVCVAVYALTEYCNGASVNVLMYNSNSCAYELQLIDTGDITNGRTRTQSGDEFPSDPRSSARG